MILAIDLVLTHGGGQQVLRDFVQVARRAGKEVTAIVAAGGWLDRSVAEIGSCVPVKAPARHQSAPFWRGIRFLGFCWTLFRQRRLFRDAHLIVVNDPELFLPAALLATVLRKDVTLYLHMAYGGLAGAVLRVAAALPRVSRLVCVSHFVRRHTDTLLSASARRKLAVIVNALPRGLEGIGGEPSPGNLSRIAIVGRLIPEKGQDVVCDLSRQLPDAEFLLVGPAENADARFVARLQQRAAVNVKLVGYQYPIVNYLRKTNIGVLLVPSRVAEAFGLTPIEGVVAGCVVIVRNLGGLAEVARDLGLLTVDDDCGFLPAIHKVRSMSREALESHLRAAREQVWIQYHPDRFERDVLAEFRW